MQIAGSKALTEQVLDKDLCSVCGACVGLCPYLKVHMGKVAGVFTCTLTEGRCYAHCPKTETDLNRLSQLFFNQAYQDEPLGIYRRIYAAKAGERIRTGKFQNGGTVTALMTCAMISGLIDSAVLTGSEGILPKPQRITKISDVAACSTTKYMAASTIAVVNQVAEEGAENLGVVGTACQLKGLAKMRLNPLKKVDFADPVALTIGLFCTWSLDTRQFLRFLEERVDTDTIIGMDVPPPPAELFLIRTPDTTLEIPLDEIRAMVLTGCSICPDMTAEWADISVGAFEGKSDWNCLIVRTEKGEQLIEQAVEQRYLMVEDFPQESLDQLTKGAINKKKRAAEACEKEGK